MRKEFLVIAVAALLAEVFIFSEYSGRMIMVGAGNNMKQKTIIQECPSSEVGNECVRESPDYKTLKQEIVSESGEKVPSAWGERIEGVKTALDTDEKVIALTFDVDPGDYDSKLVGYLESEKIPATLFFTGKWIDQHPDIFQKLSENPLFEIENHGSNHKPCSVNGKSVYGVKGAENAGDVFYEIEQNARKIETLTGKKPKYYRPATAYLDDVCLQIAEKLGYKVVNYNVLGDAGAIFSAQRIKKGLLGAQGGSVVLLHLNRPEKEIAEGVMAAVPELKKQGYRFVKLSDYNLK